MIPIQFLEHYINGSATREEKGAIVAWLGESEENKRFFAEFVSNTTLHSTLSAPDFDDRCEYMLDRLNARIDSADEAERKNLRIKQMHRWFAGIAAAAAIIAAAFILIPGAAQEQHQEEVDELLYRYANNTSGIKSVLLADRTKIFLKPGSEIEYNVKGLDDKRVISLVGEGYFDIAKDTLRPMFIKTPNLTLKVLGTAFTVKSIPGQDNVEVVLERGSVRLLSAGNVPLVRMEPGQKAVFSNTDGDLNIQQVKALPYVVEQFNLESLENVTVEQIVRYLEHIYGVRLKAEIKNPGKRYYFNFLRTGGIEEAIDVIEHLSGESVRIIE